MRSFRPVVKWALAGWTVLAGVGYGLTVSNSCSDPEQDCGAAIAYGFAATVMIWLVGLVLLLIVGYLTRRREPAVELDVVVERELPGMGAERD